MKRLGEKDDGKDPGARPTPGKTSPLAQPGRLALPIAALVVIAFVSVLWSLRPRPFSGTGPRAEHASGAAVGEAAPQRYPIRGGLSSSPPPPGAEPAACLSPADIAASFTRPRRNSTLSLLNLSPCAVPSLEHRLFAENGKLVTTGETLPRMAAFVQPRLYSLSSAKSDQIVFTTEDGPVAVYTLSDACKRDFAWEGKTVEQQMDVRRSAVGKVEQWLVDSVPQVEKKDLGYRFGYADVIEQALRRYRPFAPYFRQLAETYGVDPDLPAMIAIKETFFRSFMPTASGRINSIVSSAGCEGLFQISRRSSPVLGLVVPPSRRVSRRSTFIRENAVYINESLHPLLAVEAQLRLTRTYAMIMGSLAGGISAYHAGPLELIKVWSLALEEPATPASQGKAVAFRIRRHLFGDPSAQPSLSCDEGRLDPAGVESAALKWLSWSLRHGWKDRRNRGRFKRQSSDYLPTALAIKHILEEARKSGYFRAPVASGKNGETVAEGQASARLFEAERITISYKRGVSGRQYLAAQDLLQFLQGEVGEFGRLNPHIPLAEDGAKGPTLAAGARVFLPLGRSRDFFQRHSSTLEPTSPVVYQNGRIDPLAEAMSREAMDTAYAEIAHRRHYGGLVELASLEQLRSDLRKRCSGDPTDFYSMQCFTIAEDLRLQKQRSFRRFSSALRRLHRPGGGSEG